MVCRDDHAKTPRYPAEQQYAAVLTDCRCSSQDITIRAANRLGKGKRQMNI